MTYISNAMKLWHAFIIALRIAHRGCKDTERLDAKIQASTMPNNIKTASAAVKQAMHDLCELIQDAKNAL